MSTRAEEFSVSIQAAQIIAVATGLLFMYGTAYYEGYFRTLGVAWAIDPGLPYLLRLGCIAVQLTFRDAPLHAVGVYLPLVSIVVMRRRALFQRQVARRVSMTLLTILLAFTAVYMQYWAANITGRRVALRHAASMQRYLSSKTGIPRWPFVTVFYFKDASDNVASRVEGFQIWSPKEYVIVFTQTGTFLIPEARILRIEASPHSLEWGRE